MNPKSTIPIIIIMLQCTLTFCQTNNSSLGAIVFNLKFSSLNETGFGGQIKIVNLETKQEFIGKSANRFNSQIIIQDLPKGVYRIVELIIKTGSGQIRFYDTLKFNEIEINDTGKTYFLGAYKMKKTSEIFKLNYELYFENSTDSLKIKKQLLKTKSVNAKIDFTKKLLKSDTTKFNIK